MQDLLSIIEQSIKSSPRNYSDVKVVEFECGCKIVTAREEPQYTLFKDICSFHRKECEEKFGKGAAEKIMIPDSDY